jgi:preprotein translocase subunit Sss1|tara:strand:+ start:330 stop:467 length:138 start_codon:yes stop_codon:yes gene_type:complete
MKNINNLTDDIYESLMDEDYTALNSYIRELQSVLRETQKATEDEI